MKSFPRRTLNWGRFVASLAVWCVFALPGLCAAQDASATPEVPNSESNIPKYRVKVLTGREGMFRLTAEDLSKLGVSSVPSNSIFLTFLGNTVPVYISDGGDGVFNDKDELWFFAQLTKSEYNRISQASFDQWDKIMVDDTYSTVGVFFLSFRGNLIGPRLHLQEIERPSPPNEQELGAVISRQFLRHVHFERNETFAKFAHPQGEPTEPFFWSFINWPNKPDAQYLFDLPGLADSETTVSLNIRLYGRSYLPENPDHHVRVVLNQKELGIIEWDDATQAYFRCGSIKCSDLRPSGNRLEVHIVPPSGGDTAKIDALLLDWFELDYPSHLVTAEGLLRFEGDAMLPGGSIGGDSKWFAIGSTHSRLYQLDRRLRWLSELPQLPSGYSGDVKTFWSPAPQGREFLYFSPESLGRAVADSVYEPKDVFASLKEKNFIIVTHPDFKKQAERLAAFREAQGWKPAVVTTEDIFTQLSEGYPTPRGLKTFFSQLHDQNSNPPRPIHVLLVGDASWDVLGVESKTFVNFIPSYYFGSSRAGYYASDNWFVDINDDHAPEFAIGRLPVRSEKELEEVVNKYIEYSETPAPTGWENRVALLASYEPYIHSSLQGVAKDFFGERFDVSQIFAAKEKTTTDDYAATVTLAMDKGNVLTIFAGHGGSFVWQVGPNPLGGVAKDLFNLQNVEQMTNKGAYPMIFSISCYTNTFDNPTLESSIGEKFVLEPNRGALGVVSASWRMSLPAGFQFLRRWLQALKQGPQTTVGEAILEAKRDRSIGTELQEGMVLLGDPTQTIRFDPSFYSTPEKPASN